VPCAIGSPAPVVLFGQLSGDIILALALENLETLRDPTVQQPSLRWRYQCVRRITYQVVGEVVAGGLFSEDAVPPQFVDRADHDVDVEIAGLGKQIEGEIPADSRSQPGDFACLRRCCLSAPRAAP
jgi:hypothetical protein